MNHGPPIAMFGGCHRSAGPLGVAIMLCTTWPWRWLKPGQVSTHSGVGFVYRDGHREIYEAFEGAGWRGPIPVLKVEGWVSRNKRRRFTMYDIPEYLISPDAATYKLKRCEALMGVWRYSIWQLPRMGLRHFLRFLPINTTADKVVCSEAATIIFDPEIDVCKLTGKRKPDLVTPYDFEQAMKLVTAKPKRAPGDSSDAYKD